MQSNRETALGYIFDDEGGFAIRATEPGGAVNMGISMQTFVTWRLANHQPQPTIDDLKNMTRSEAEEIYDSLYLKAIHFDSLPAGLDYATLDSAVNEGIGATLGLLSLTSHFQNDVAARIKLMSDTRIFIKQHRDEWSKYGPGWTARISGRVPARAYTLAGVNPPKDNNHAKV